MTKKMLHELVTSTALQGMPHIRSNAICPGWILDPVDQPPLRYYDAKEKITSKNLSRHGDLADITQSAIFLEQNDFINGQILFIDGGRHLL